VLETLIRELVSTAANPLYYKINSFTDLIKSYKDDHNLLTDKFREYDKRLHQCVEYCREKCEDNSLIKKADLEKIKVEVDDRILGQMTQLTKMKKAVESLDDAQAQSTLVIDTMKSDNYKSLEAITIKLKDHLAKEMVSV
jgi:predicted negative regulator of RcsB-dependent stress response